MMTLLGRTGIHVSPLCFGTMSFGGDADEANQVRVHGGAWVRSDDPTRGRGA